MLTTDILNMDLIKLQSVKNIRFIWPYCSVSGVDPSPDSLFSASEDIFSRT